MSSSSSNTPNFVQFRDNSSEEFNMNWLKLSLSPPSFPIKNSPIPPHCPQSPPISPSNIPNLVQFRDNSCEEFNKNWLKLSLTLPPFPIKNSPILSQSPPRPPTSLSLSLPLSIKDPKTFQVYDLEEPETLQELQEEEVQDVQETHVTDLHFAPLNPSSNEDQEMQQVSPPAAASTIHRLTTRTRQSPTQNPEDAEPIILDTPPFPSATKLWATVHSMEYLLANGINSITGEVTCKKCENRETISFDLRTKFKEVEKFVSERAHFMHNRAPPMWLNPKLMACSKCMVANQVRPIIDDRESHINWLFLFLGQWLGCCTMRQLKWFCKYTRNHSTGAKDRVLFYTYATIGNQLDPNRVFNLMHS